MATFVNDTFTDTNATNITSHTGETGATWTKHSYATNTNHPQINASNALVTTESNVRENYYASGVPATADYTVTLDYAMTANTTEEIFGPMGRLSTSASTGYLFVFYRGGAQFLMQSLVAGTATTIGTSVNHALAAGTYRMTLDMSGSTIAGRVQRTSDSNWLTSAGAWQAGQVNCISTTDTAVTAAGKAGVYQLCIIGGGARPTIDNFSAGDPADTTAPILTSPTGTATGSTTATGTVSTDEANGTLYRLASTNATETAATVKAAALTTSVTATDVQTTGVTFTGLTPSTVYYAHYVHTDAAANDSARVSSASFTTAASDTISRPASDVSATGWTSTAGNLFSTIDDVGAADDADYVTSPALSATPAPYVFTFTNSPKAAGTWNVKVRAWAPSGAATMRVKLLDGAGAVLGTSADVAINATPTTYNNNVTIASSAVRASVEFVS